LHQSNFPLAIEKTPILAAKWVFLEWFARVSQAARAVETLWKLFFAKKLRDRLDDKKLHTLRRSRLYHAEYTWVTGPLDPGSSCISELASS
jgi:hypothetical protein